MPRSFSSFSRSVSQPVKNLTSAVLPWSTWPAVPRVMLGFSSGHGPANRSLAERCDAGPRSRSPHRRPAACAGRSAPGRSGCGRRRAARGGAARRASSSALSLRRADGHQPRRQVLRRAASRCPSGRSRRRPSTRGVRRAVAARAARCARPARRSRRGCGASIRRQGTSRSAVSSSRKSVSVASSAASVSLSTRSARASGFLRTASIRSCAAEDDAALRAADELVGAGRHEVGARRIESCSVGSVWKPNRERSSSAPAPTSSISDQPARVGDAHQVRQRHLGREPGDPVVARMDAQDGGRVLGDGVLVVARVRLVRGAHLDQLRAAGRHDLRQAEGAADLDQLPARDDDLPARGHRVEHEERGGGVVVDHRGGLRPGELLQQPLRCARRAGSARRSRCPPGAASSRTAPPDLPQRRAASTARPGRCAG